MERVMRAPTSSPSTAGNGTATTRTRGSTGRKNAVSPPRPRVQTVTSWPRPARASARARVWTTPPRGFVEYVSSATLTALRRRR